MTYDPVCFALWSRSQVPGMEFKVMRYGPGVSLPASPRGRQPAELGELEAGSQTSAGRGWGQPEGGATPPKSPCSCPGGPTGHGRAHRDPACRGSPNPGAGWDRT